MKNVVIVVAIGIVVFVTSFFVWQQNQSVKPGIPNGFFATLDECAQHISSAQICLAVNADGVTYWKVVNKTNFAHQPTPQSATTVSSSTVHTSATTSIVANSIMAHEAGNSTAIMATIQGSCAPFDAAALGISMPYQGGVFRAEVFSKGLELFKAGKSVVIDEKGSGSTVNETGLSRLCLSSTKCTPYLPGEVEIRNPSGVYTQGATTSLNIIIKGIIVPVEAGWKNTRVHCG